jgi:hypothetical protein
VNRRPSLTDSLEKGLGNPREALGRWIGLRVPGVGSRELGELTFATNPATATLLPAEVNLLDGLGSLDNLDPESIYLRGSNEMRAIARSRVIDLQLPHPCATRLRSHTLFPKTEVMELKLVADAPVRSFPIETLESVGVRVLKVLNEVVHVKGESDEFLLRGAGMRDATARMRSFPHVRRGFRAAQVDPGIIESFFQEATALKGVPAGDGEFLALFRHIPVALISRVRFLEEKGVLLYIVVPTKGPLTTRLHDLAAIREPAKGIIHLVVHRTRSRAVPIL